MRITAEQLERMLCPAPRTPGAKERERATKWVDPLNSALSLFNIDTPRRVAAFVSQLLHESAMLSRMTENLNYSAAALVATWPRRFPDMAFAKQYERNPEKIANAVYGDRLGNKEPGDGWRFRGRGPIQITGRDNYTTCGRRLGVDLASSPELLEDPTIGAMSAGWYWDSRCLNPLADIGDVVGITKKINGGTHGLAERMKLYDHCLQVLGGR